MESRYEEWRAALAPDGTVYYIADPDGNFDVFALRDGKSTPDRVSARKQTNWTPL